MATGINASAFCDIIGASMARIEELERTPKGRAQLALQWRQEARRLRAAAAGGNRWRDAGGEFNTHVAPEEELARRALERAKDLENQAHKLDGIKGIQEPYAAYMKEPINYDYRANHERIFGKKRRKR